MSPAEQVAPAKSPRRDRNGVLFGIETGGQRIECAISREALQDERSPVRETTGIAAVLQQSPATD
jgi:hypothetical protein